MADGVLYSTEFGSMCPECNKPIAECICKNKKMSMPAPGAKDGAVRVSRETKGRKGKGVTVVSGLPLDGFALKFLAKELKQFVGCGGTVKDDTIEIQGENRDKVCQFLEQKGYKVKRVGG